MSVDLDKYKKCVYCHDHECMWNVEIEDSIFIKHHRDDEPIGPADAYAGVCSRPEIGLVRTTVFSGQGKYKVTKCDYRSDRGIKGHMDFSKLLDSSGSPYGGNIPDSSTPDAAYH